MLPGVYVVTGVALLDVTVPTAIGIGDDGVTVVGVPPFAVTIATFVTSPAALGLTVAVIVYVTTESPVIINVSFMSLDPDAVFPLALPVPLTLDVYVQLVNALIVVPLASVVFWSANISFTNTVDFPPVFVSVNVNVTVLPGVYVVLEVVLLDVTIPCNGISVHAKPVIHTVPGVVPSIVATFINDFVVVDDNKVA